MREVHLDAALDKKANATTNLTNYCIAKKSAVQAQSKAIATLVPPLGDVATTTATVPSKSTVISDTKIMKRKLPGPREGWKGHSGKTHRVHYDAMKYHKTVLSILWQIMDIVHE
jgi:hypothetical protein